MHFFKGTWNCDEISWTEPNGSRTTRHDQRGRRRWQRDDRFPGVRSDDGSSDEESSGRGDRTEGIVQGLRQERRWIHQRIRAAAGDDDPRREAVGRRGQRDDQGSGRRWRWKGQLRRICQNDDVKVVENKKTKTIEGRQWVQKMSTFRESFFFAERTSLTCSELLRKYD